MRLIPTPSSVQVAAANPVDRALSGHLADVRPMPRTLVDEGPQHAVSHLHSQDQDPAALPVLLMPPLAAPASAFDPRRGCSLAEHLVVTRRPTYREFLEQVEAVDRFTANMAAYPGRTFGQLSHRFIRANDLHNGSLDLGGRRIELAEVRVPVLVIAGRDDTIAPQRAVSRMVELLPHAPQVEDEVLPGGHLGVLTGRRARSAAWPRIDRFLAEHDRVPARRRRAPSATAAAATPRARGAGGARGVRVHPRHGRAVPPPAESSAP
jgi:pimeloyl-ACP methyl ester carboxylesterase